MITLATLPQAPAQDVFDQVAEHLLKQGRPSYSEQSRMCAYRGDEGLKCAAGCLVSDEEYDVSMEQGAWDQLQTSCSAVTIPDAHMAMILDLQVMHDEAYELAEGTPYTYWLEELEEIAGNYDLSAHKLRYRVIDEEGQALFVGYTQREAEEELTYYLNRGHDAYLQCPGDF